MSVVSSGRPVGDLDRLLNPGSVALFGASEDGSKLRGRVTRLIVENGYAGDLYFINPTGREIAGRRSHKSLADIGGPVDLAIVVVPAEHVMGVLEDCAQAGVGHVIIMSSGFAEEGGAQANVQARIADLARASGMRICGPNAEGFHNELAKLSATFSLAVDKSAASDLTVGGGRIGVIAQSGGLGFALYQQGRNLGLDFSSVVTTGNEVDLSAADFLAHMARDPDTAAVLLFLETIRDGAGFTRAMEAMAAARKPVVAVKVGRSVAGGRATVSHTGAIAGWDAAYDAMFARLGVSVADDLGSALAIISGFVTNPLPGGPRAGIVTVSGGAGALAADRLSARGLQIPQLSDDVQDTIRKLIPSYGTTLNPVDVTGQASRTGAPLRAMELLSEGEEVDAIVLAHTMSHASHPPVEVAGLKALLSRKLKPLFVFTYTSPSAFGQRAVADAGAVTYRSLSDVTLALSAMNRYREFLDARAASPVSAAVAVERLGHDAGVLSEHRAKALLERHGIDLPPRVLVADAAGLEDVPAGFFPVAAKVQSSDIPHKTEAGGVRLNLGDTNALAAARVGILEAARRYLPDARIDGVLVEPMAPKGVEMIVGMVRDPVLGPIVTVGAGGVMAELLQDVARLQAPVAEAHALTMIRSLRTFPLLDGFRGAEPADLAALARLVVQISEFATRFADDVSEVELNPVLVHPAGQGITIADALVVIDPKPTVRSVA